MGDITLEQFEADALAFLEANASRKEAEKKFVWGEGSDKVAVFEERDKETERRDVARACDWRQKKFDAGFGWITGPEPYGGRGLPVAYERAYQRLEAGFEIPNQSSFTIGLGMVAPTILAHGSDAAKDAYLRSMYRAEIIGCQLFSEPGAGSDLGGLTTRAEPDGDRFVVNGQKVWCSGGRYSGWGILMARTNPEAKKHDGISFFLVDMASPGIEVRPLKQMTGEAEFDEVFFTDVDLPPEALLGPLNGGWGVGMAVLTSERGHIGASVIGLERRLAGIARMAEDHELTAVQRDRLVGLLSRGKVFTWMARRQGPIASTAASLMKLGITELMFEASMLRGEVAGAGAMLEGPDAAGMLAAPGGRIAGGTSQVQRNIIGERLLGLPREPKG